MRYAPHTPGCCAASLKNCAISASNSASRPSRTTRITATWTISRVAHGAAPVVISSTPLERPAGTAAKAPRVLGQVRPLMGESGDSYRCGGMCGRLPVSPKPSHGRPLGHDRQGRRRQVCEFRSRIHGLAAYDGEHRFQPLNVFFGYREVIRRQHGKIGKVTWNERTLLAFLTRKPGATDRP